MIPDFLYQEPTIRALADLIRLRYDFYTDETNRQFNNVGFLRDTSELDYWKQIYNIVAEPNASIDNIKAMIQTKNVARQQLTDDLLKRIARLYTDNEIEVWHQGSANALIDYVLVEDRKVVLMSGAVDTTQLSNRFVSVHFKHSNPSFLWHWGIKEDGTSHVTKVPNMNQSVNRVILREVSKVYEINVVESGNEAALNATEITTRTVPNWTIIIKFIGKYGVPNNINNFKAIIREIVPAHLDIVYEYTYSSWQQVDNKNLTWQQVDNKNLTWKQVDEGGLIQ